MGDRYFIDVVCPICGAIENDVYYAPTCGAVEWTCPDCGEILDLEEYTGISKEEASNKDIINAIVQRRE